MSKELVGVFWMVVSGLSFVVVTGLVRFVGTDLPAVEAAFIRYSFGLILLVPFLLRLWYLNNSRNPASPGVPAPISSIGSNGSNGSNGGPGRIKQLLPMYIIRGLVHALGVVLWFYAMARLPVALVTAIGFITPVCITIAAAFFLGEIIKLRRALGIVVAILGGLIILAPELSALNAGIWAQLIAAPCFAASFILAKQLSQKASSEEIVAMLTIFCTLALLPGAIATWTTPNYTELFWLLLTAVAATFGHYAMTQAVRYAPLSMLQPFTFLQLVWASLMGYLLFSEEPTINIFIGASIIVGSTSYIAHREYQMTKKDTKL